MLPEESNDSFLMEKIYDEDDKLQMDSCDIDDEKMRKENGSLGVGLDDENGNGK